MVYNIVALILLRGTLVWSQDTSACLDFESRRAAYSSGLVRPVFPMHKAVMENNVATLAERLKSDEIDIDLLDGVRYCIRTLYKSTCQAVRYTVDASMHALTRD